MTKPTPSTGDELDEFVSQLLEDHIDIYSQDRESSAVLGADIEEFKQAITRLIEREKLRARLYEAVNRHENSQRLAERARKWQLTETGRSDMILGEVLMPAEDRVNQLQAQLAELEKEQSDGQ